MYRPKKYVRLDPLARTPKLSDIRNLLQEASKARSCTIEQPWRSENKKLPFSLTVRLELGGGEPIWTLYEGEGANSRVMWSTSFADVELLYDVFTLSLPSEGPTIFSPVDQRLPGRGAVAEADEATLRAREFFNKPSEETRFSVAASGFSEESLGDGLAMRSKPIEEGGQFLKSEALPGGAANTGEVKPAPAAQTSNIFPDKEIALELPASATSTGEMPAVPASPQTVASSQTTASPQASASPLPPQAQGAFLPPGYPPYPYAYPGYPYPAQVPYNMPPAYPGYAYPPQVPYNAAYPPQAYLYPASAGDGLSTAGTVGLGGSAAGALEHMAGNVVAPHPELVKKVPNIMLGTFLLEAGLVPKATIDAALQVQALVSQGTLSAIKAAEAVRRAHLRGASLETSEVAEPPRPNEFVVRVKPQLGQVLVMAGIISAAQLKMALQLQDVLRAGSLTMEQACERLQNLTAQTKVNTLPTSNGYDEAQLEKALDLLKQAGVISADVLEEARHFAFKNRKALDQVLVETAKLDKLTIDAAVSCLEAMETKGLRIDKAIQGLFYCQRMRLPFDEAVKELGIV